MSTQLDGMRRFVAQRPTAAPAGDGGSRVVVVGSGKGGVGTSTVAALLALLAAADDRSVLLVDAVDGLGAQHLLLGLRPERTLAELRGGELLPRDLLVPVTDRLSLLPGGDGDSLSEAPLATAERRALIRRIATLYPAYDLVVVDGGARLESVVAACGAGVARLLAVTTADRIAMAATHALVKALDMRMAGLAVDVLVNRVDEPTAMGAFGELSTAAGRFLQRSLSFAGAVPDDGSMSAGVAAGMAIHEAAVGSASAIAMQPVLQYLIRLTSAPRPRLPSGYGRWG